MSKNKSKKDICAILANKGGRNICQTNQQILTKEATVATIKKNLDIPMAVSDAEAFLVDTINNASTLPKLAPIYRDVPAGNIDALSVGRP